MWLPQTVAKPKLRAGQIDLPNFALGCGWAEHTPGGYAMGTSIDTRFGVAGPGLLEAVDLTGIAAGYRVIKAVKHNNVYMLATTNGTDSKVYRKETTWVLKETVTSAVCTDMVSFTTPADSTVAVLYGTSDVFRYSSDDGANWTDSTLTGARYANYALVQQNGRASPRVVLCTNPNGIYFVDSLINGSTVTTIEYVGTASTTDNYFTSVIEDDTGFLLIGMRRDLWTRDNSGTYYRVSPREYPDPPADAGGQGDRKNFEWPAVVNGRVYYIVGGYDIHEYANGRLLREHIAPRWVSGPGKVPALDLPINAILGIGHWLIAAIGDGNTASTRDSQYNPGGGALLQNTFPTTSYIYVCEPEKTGPTDAPIWHGSIVQADTILRGMWYDEDTKYLMMQSGASTSANVQQQRAVFLVDNPINRFTSAVMQVTLDTWTLETGAILSDTPRVNTWLRAVADEVPIGGTTAPYLTAKCLIDTTNDNTPSYVTVARFDGNAGYWARRAALGLRLPARPWRRQWWQFTGAGESANVITVMRSASVDIQ